MKITDREADYIVTRSPDATAKELAAAMKEQDVGCVIVTERDEPVGLITDRDLVLEVIYQDVNPKEVTAEEIMSGNVVTADVSSDLLELVQKLETNAIRRLPITKDGKVVNIVTLDDLNRLFVRQLGLLNRVAEAESPFRIMRQLFEDGQ